ncbi:DUF7544 domain-containing protein [Natronolimnohabitans innermongolicus]|uniref:Uncharacterized protein n=1 Tax=Natronolimnohabitans innermongolicus JCM 12255 TaxID=1227499 RepID=L9XEE3_9EURY|nr:DUF4013 domain-containing protein [Natronolimnohabitans innermongolicus]ELY59987.1 hypothetical protein C493_04428 [Natronolimnohabitans innermongolicus JCM 12255]
MHAIDDLSDALETTRGFLTPVRLGLWLRLAVVVVFVSSLGLGVGPSVFGSDFAVLFEEPTVEQPPEVEDEVWEEVPVEELLAAALLVAAVAFVAWLCYALVAGIMEFVFLESLRSTEIRVRRYFGRNLGRGVRLFLFRLGVLIIFAALGALPGAVAAVGDGSITDLSTGLLALYSLYGFGLYLAYSAVRRFTSEFVAPIMLLEERGVLASWRRFWGTLTANLAEYTVYLLLVWFLSIAVTITAWVVVGIGLFALAIAFGFVVVLLLVVGGPLGAVVALPIALFGIACGILFMGLVWAPIATYFQYYALLLLGDTNGDLDLLPDQRAAVRAAGAGGGGMGRGSWDDADWSASNWDGSGWGGTDGWDDDTDPWADPGDPDDARPADESWRGSEVERRDSSDWNADPDPWDDAVDGDETEPWDRADDGGFWGGSSGDESTRDDGDRGDDRSTDSGRDDDGRGGDPDAADDRDTGGDDADDERTW